MAENREEEKVKNELNREKSKMYLCCVLQPFGIRVTDTGKTDFEAVYKALKPLQTFNANMPLKLVRADTMPYWSERLLENVHMLLGTSDFFIADITGNNPNVLYEIGFVMGIGRGNRIILITQIAQDIPANLQGLIMVRYRDGAFEDLAIDVAQHLVRVKDAIDRNIETSDSYDVKAYAKRSNVDINFMFEKATEKIDILQTNLVTIGTNYMNVLINALERNNNLKIRILTLDPQSQYVGTRAQQLGFEDIDTYRNELSASLNILKNTYYGFKGRVKLRKYDDCPSQITYIVDNQVVSSVISVTGRSRSNCAFILDKNRPGVRHSFIDHFETLWDHERTRVVL